METQPGLWRQHALLWASFLRGRSQAEEDAQLCGPSGQQSQVVAASNQVQLLWSVCVQVRAVGPTWGHRGHRGHRGETPPPLNTHVSPFPDAKGGPVLTAAPMATRQTQNDAD